MIIITGGAGFIGSCLAKELPEVKIVDELDDSDKWKNLVKLNFLDVVSPGEFLKNLHFNEYQNIDAIIHLGACTDTTEQDNELIFNKNFEYSKILYDWCVVNKVRFIYASSAATYGDGSDGYSDTEVKQLKPLNMYGYSKHLFDKYVIQRQKPPQWIGLKFFNVYGPNEYHKGKMASMIYQLYRQIKKNKEVKLFRSYKPDIKHGDQTRDFVYVKDVVKVIKFFVNNPQWNGIYNVGTGKARSFNDIVTILCQLLEINELKTEWIDMPDNVKKHYQYHTEAEVQKLRTKYKQNFYSLEDGIEEYVLNYLEKDGIYEKFI